MKPRMTKVTQKTHLLLRCLKKSMIMKHQMNRIIHKMNLFIQSIPQEPDNNQETTNSTPYVVETNFNII